MIPVTWQQARRLKTVRMSLRFAPEAPRSAEPWLPRISLRDASDSD